MARRFRARDFGTCLSYAGATAKCQVTRNANIETNALTAACWIMLRQSSGTVNFFRKFSTAGFSFRITGGAYTATVNRGSNVIATSTSTPILGRWHHVAMTYQSSPGSVLFYLNGVLDKTQAGAGGNIVWDTDDLYIGNDSGLASPCYGYMDEPRIWGVALSATEIADLYYDGTFSRTNLTGEWLFNEGSGSTATDSSTKGNNGVIAGATYSTQVPMIARSLA